MNTVFQALLFGGLLIAALVALVVWWRRRYLLQGRTSPVGAIVTEPNTSSQITVQRQRLRDLGLQFGNFSTGKFNAITDVDGVKVGHATLSSGDGALVPGSGPVRTGVTAIIPH